MSISINTNISSLVSQRNLSKSAKVIGETFENLSSGLRINNAEDDAAGLAISTRMTAQIRGNNQAIRNVADGISVTQIAEEGISHAINIMQRMRELAVQSANGTYTLSDRVSMETEINQLKVELSNITSNTEFNGQSLLDGSFTDKKLQIGGNESISLDISHGILDSLTIQTESESTILIPFVRTAEEIAADDEFIRNRNAQATAAGQLFTFETSRPIPLFRTVSIQEIDIQNISMQDISILTQGDAQNSISIVDKYINTMSNQRSNIGALQNRLYSIDANLTTATLNTSQARSRIMDADMAQETATLTQSNITQQASTAILAQANQQPQMVLQLLR